MQTKNKIAVIGGAGKSGQFLTCELLKQNFPIRMLLRFPEKLKIENTFIEMVTGDARNPMDVLELIKGCHAVISVLGQPKGELSIFSAATKNILYAMDFHHIKRYVSITGLSVDSPTDHKGAYAAGGTAWMKKHYPETTADKQVEWEILNASGLDWTLVRLPLIDLTETKSATRISIADCPGEKISAASLAVFLVDQLEDKTFIRQSPFIANSD
jgi:putative NADH-flavin reductase